MKEKTTGPNFFAALAAGVLLFCLFFSAQALEASLAGYKLPFVDSLLNNFNSGKITKASFEAGIVDMLEGGPGAKDTQAVTFDHMTILAPDMVKTATFFQTVLQMPALRIITDNTYYLGVGNGFDGIQPSGNSTASFNHFDLGLKNYPAGQSAHISDVNGMPLQISYTEYAIGQTSRHSKMQTVDSLLSAFTSGKITRASFEAGITGLLEGGPGAKDLQAVTIDHVIMKAPDVQKTSKYYQNAYLMPLVRQSVDTVYLAVGNSYLEIQPSANGKAYVDKYCFGLKNFNAANMIKSLKDKGVTVVDTSSPDIITFTDLNGMLVQVSATGYAINQMHPSTLQRETMKQPAAQQNFSVQGAGAMIKVRFSLIAAGRVTAKVMTLDGRRIARFDFGELGPGRHDISLPLTNGKTLVSGGQVSIWTLESQSLHISRSYCFGVSKRL
jgi:catechol 2,3-dioxygenase-like lactoylglutathione lyase family enzyme